MRKVFVGGLCALYLAGVFGAVGCSPSKDAKTPSKQLDTPKDAPKAAGAGGGTTKGNTGTAD